jgi:glucose/arabinose dehydrogenase
MRRLLALLAISTLSLSCAQRPRAMPADDGFGPNPPLPPPRHSLIPTIDIAPARGWKAGERPTPGKDFAVARFAAGLDHPRWLYVLPNGDVLVAETNAPPRETTGFKNWVMKKVMKRTGGATPSANRIRLLRDADGDGVAELSTEFASGLHSPFGMALIGDALYVADTDAVVRLTYREGATSAEGAPVVVAPLPAGAINHHWTKNLIATRGPEPRLYVTVGSNSNVGENGLDAEQGRALILELDPATGTTREFATGLRNPNGLAWQPTSGALWTVVNERDELGDDLVPDYLTAVAEGGFYGWPYSYYGDHVDPRVAPQNPALVARAAVPDYALGSHTAPLGLAFYEGSLLPARYVGGAFVGLHGSWNRKPLSGYKVIFVPFRAGEPAGPPEDVLTGFIDADGEARGRPVGVAVDRSGALLVADDVGNCVWRVTPAPGSRTVRPRRGWRRSHAGRESRRWSCAAGPSPGSRSRSRSRRSRSSRAAPARST